MTDGTKIPVHQIPLQRMGKAQEVAELVNFLIEARYITGQVMENEARFEFHKRIFCILKILRKQNSQFFLKTTQIYLYFNHCRLFT